jgi:phosphoserine aminotransferase
MNCATLNEKYFNYFFLPTFSSKKWIFELLFNLIPLMATKKPSKKHNFSAGPAILPATVIKQAYDAVKDFADMGLSILEISHRENAFTKVVEEAEALTKELLGLGDDYRVLFLTGGASTQFYQVPMNILNEDQTAAYSDTGEWASRAIVEAKLFGKVNVLASSKDKNYSYIPRKLNIPKDSAYFHFTSNNTIFGTEYHWTPETEVPLICDMSSDIFSRPIEASKYSIIYAGAQKNLGPAGVTLVIIKKDMMGKANRTIPTMLKYETHAKNDSLYNTPPVFPIYVCLLTLRWLKEMGGLAAMEKINKAKANMLYKEIDRNPCFKGTVEKKDRSRMNVCFVPTKPEFEETFLKMAKENGLVGLKGHRSVGGFRASLYNALPLKSVKVLVATMQEFEKKYGA